MGYYIARAWTRGPVLRCHSLHHRCDAGASPFGACPKRWPATLPSADRPDRASCFVAHPQLYAWTTDDASRSGTGARRWRSSTSGCRGRSFFGRAASTPASGWCSPSQSGALAPAGPRRRSAMDAREVRLSAAFLVVFGVTFTLASFDWLMSLEPHWYSTIFGVYNFAGPVPERPGGDHPRRAVAGALRTASRTC